MIFYVMSVLFNGRGHFHTYIIAHEDYFSNKTLALRSKIFIE